DIDPGDILEIKEVKQPKFGVAKFDREYVYYTPNKGFSKQDQMEYTITDGNDTATAMIYFKVEPTPQIKNYEIHWKSQTTGTEFDVMEGINDSVTGEKLELTGEFAKYPSHGTA